MSGPVLVYGCAELQKAGCELLMVTQGIDAAILRNLDQQPFRVLVSESQFGMRGLDDRCL